MDTCCSQMLCGSAQQDPTPSVWRQPSLLADMLEHTTKLRESMERVALTLSQKIEYEHRRPAVLNATRTINERQLASLSSVARCVQRYLIPHLIFVIQCGKVCVNV